MQNTERFAGIKVYLVNLVEWQKFSTRSQSLSPEGGTSVGAPSRWLRPGVAKGGSTGAPAFRPPARPSSSCTPPPPATAAHTPASLPTALPCTDTWPPIHTQFKDNCCCLLFQTAPHGRGGESMQGNTPGQRTINRTAACQIAYAGLLALLVGQWGKWSILSRVCLTLPLQSGRHGSREMLS